MQRELADGGVSRLLERWWGLLLHLQGTLLDP